VSTAFSLHSREFYSEARRRTRFAVLTSDNQDIPQEFATTPVDKCLERDTARCYRADVTFGAVIKAVRGEHGLSQAEVARRAGIDEQSRISEYETEKAEPSIVRARQLARGLGVLLTVLVARWEGVDLVWTTAGRKAIAETKGAVNASVAKKGGAMADDLGESLLTTLGLVPAEQREEFVTHCFQTAMHWRTKARHAATGTGGPKD
jgi:transcriptional regulator with XRE-family HTH domain